MAALGIGLGFAALGGAVGATGVAGLTIQTGVSIGLTVGSVVASLAFAGDAPAIKGPRLGDTKVQVSTYGVNIAIVHGSVRTAGNVTYIPDPPIREVEETTGGKGGLFGGGTVTTYKYFATLEVGLCEGPIDEVIAIWADSKLIFDQRQDVTLKKRYKKTQITVRDGSETQLPSSVWETEYGAGEVPGGRGVASVLIEDLPLIDFGNRIPNITCLVARSATTVVNDFIDWETSGAPAVNADGYVIDPTRGNMVSMGFAGGAYFVRYDPLSGKYLNDSADQPFQEYALNNIVHAIDPDTGHVYGVGDPDGLYLITVAVPVRYDPVTLRPLACGTTTVPNPSNGCVVNGALLHFLEGGVSTNGRIYTFGKMNFDLLWTVDPVVDYGYGRVRTMVHDRDGYLWAAGSVTADSEFRLYKIAPSGLLVSTWDFETQMTGGAGADIILRIQYDSFRHRLILVAPTRNNMALFDIDSETLSPVLNDLGVSGGHLAPLQLAPSKSGKLWMQQTNTVWKEFDVTNMTTGPTVVRTINPQDHGNAKLNYFSILLDEDRQMLICLEDVSAGAASQFQFLPLDRKTPGTTTLAVVVADLCAHAGLEAGDIDVTELTDVVNGYVAARQSSARDMIEPLVQVYFFDGYQGDAKMKFIKRGGAIEHTVLQDDTAAHEPDSEPPPVLKKTRAQETEVPKRVNVRFMDLNEDYQEGQQSDGREVTEAKGEVKIELPIALTADEAKVVATKILREAMVNRDKRELVVGPKHWDIDPTDIVFIEEF